MDEEQTEEASKAPGDAPGAKPSAQELLANARMRWQRLRRGEAAATLDRVDYAVALVAVRENRAYLKEGFDDFFSWVLKETGLQHAQAKEYLDAARVPRELVKDQFFDWKGLALLGRASDWPEAQRLLAEGIARLGTNAARQAWISLRSTPSLTHSADERLVAALRKALDSAAMKTARARKMQRHGALRNGVRAVAKTVARISTGEQVSEEERRMLSSIRQLLESTGQDESATPNNVQPGAPAVGQAARAANSEKVNDSNSKGPDFRPSKDRPPQGEPGASEVAQTRVQPGQPRGTGAVARQPSQPHHAMSCSELLRIVRESEAAAVDDSDDDDDDDFDEEYLESDDTEDQVSPEFVASLFAAQDDDDRIYLERDVFAMLILDCKSYAWQDFADEFSAFADGLPKGERRTQVEDFVLKATSESITMRWPRVFPMLLHLAHPELPEILGMLAHSKLIPKKFQEEAAAAAAVLARRGAEVQSVQSPLG